MSNSFSGGFKFISLWIHPSWIRGLLPEANSLVFAPSREHRVYFLQTSVTSVCIRALTYPSLMANCRKNDHRNNDVDNTILTRLSSLSFIKRLMMRINNFLRRVSKLYVRSSKRFLLFLLGNHLIATMINIFKDALLTIRKFHSLMEINASWILVTDFLIWKSILIFGRFVMKKNCGLYLIN